MNFSNYDNIAPQIFESLTCEFISQLKSRYCFNDDGYFEVWYNEKDFKAYVTNHNFLDNVMSLLFHFEIVFNPISRTYEHMVIPYDSSMIPDGVFSIEDYDEFYQGFREEYSNANVIKDISINIELFKSLHPDYYSYDESIFEYDTKEATLVKLKDKLALYQTYISELEAK